MAYPDVHKQARAGLEYLKDPSISQAEALTRAGYSASTAAKPAANGLTVQRCVATARKVYDLEEPGKIVSLARRALTRKLELTLESDAKLDKVRLSELAKTAQVVEVFYSAAGADPTADARQFVDRLEWLDAVTREMRKRRSTPVVDAESVKL